MENGGMTQAGDGASMTPITTTLAQLTPLDFTYVVYDPVQPHSLLLAYLTFLPILLGFFILNAALLRRDLEAIYHAAGLLLSSAINHVLKRIAKQPRPIGSAKLGHGMPSDHAQFSFFFVAYFSHWLVYRARLTRRARVCAVFALISLATIVCWSRVHLGVHTLGQVAVGSFVGIVLGTIWGRVARGLVWDRLFPLVEQSAIGRYFHLKDCSQLPNGVESAQQFEYECYMKARGDGRTYAYTQQLQAEAATAKSNGAARISTRGSNSKQN